MSGTMSARTLGALVVLGARSLLAMPLQDADRPGIHGINQANHPPHMVKQDKGYWFQAFPHSKVPVSSLFIIILAFGITISFMLITAVFSLLWSSPLASRARKERAEAISNLRVLGVRSEKDVPPPPQDEENTVPLAAEITGGTESNERLARKGQRDTMTTLSSTLSPSQESDDDQKESKDVFAQQPANLMPMSTSGGSKKGKDANEIAGPIVPVLRNEDPDVAYETDSGDESGEQEDEEYGAMQYNPPQDRAPAYEPQPPTQPPAAAPVVQPMAVPPAASGTAAEPVAQPVNEAVAAPRATEQYDLPPPIVGSATVATEIPAQPQSAPVAATANPTWAGTQPSDTTTSPRYVP